MRMHAYGGPRRATRGSLIDDIAASALGAQREQHLLEPLADGAASATVVNHGVVVEVTYVAEVT